MIVSHRGKGFPELVQVPRKIDFISTRCFFLLLVICLTSFKSDERLQQLAQQSQQRLNLLHGLEPEMDKIRKCEITISDEGFLRHRKTYISGKQEYYSLNLSRLQSLDYYGSTSAGQLTIRTIEDDVIVQTYNDRSGNVDSMAVRFDLHVGAIEPEDVAALQRDLLEIKRLIRP